MAETLEKLRPDRDLQVYFERPSAVAALSNTSPSGLTISGTFRQQFDWAVLEWNRDNVFEHPLFRNLPDGDLSGLTLSYEETRTNCIPLDSDLYPTVDWPYLRIWADNGGTEEFYRVRLKDYAVPVEGSYECAAAEFELQGAPTTNDYVGIAWSGEHHTYQVYAVDTLETIVRALTDSVNAFSPIMNATQIGRRIRLRYVGAGQTLPNSTTGANGNRWGAYSYVAGAGTESWVPSWQRFTGGQSPTKWRITLDFGNLVDIQGRPVPTHAVRKMRWTYSADLQYGAYQRTEFQVEISNWTVTGSNRVYSVAGRGSQRIEDNSPQVRYVESPQWEPGKPGGWTAGQGNFSGGTIHHCTLAGSSLSCTYRMAQPHTLYIGTRLAYSAASVQVCVDGQPARTANLLVPGEDVLVRLPVGDFGPGPHSVTVTHGGPDGAYLYFDFLEAAVKTTELPALGNDQRCTPATDWDTDHSLAVAPERTAWMIHSLGFHGRANHYVGAMWYYELDRPGHRYASGTVEFVGSPQPSQITEIILGIEGNQTLLQHLNHVGDTAETIAKAFELELNRGYTAVRAESQGNRLTIYARAMGSEGNSISLAANPPGFTQVSGPTLSGGVYGEDPETPDPDRQKWRTDLSASPRLNRAVRDWSLSYYRALKAYGIDVAAAFSMELRHGEDKPSAGIAQRYPGGGAAMLNTPALQTNFSPASLAFWKEVYREMADLMQQAGCRPYLQFGEVQWWYFPDLTGMPFYDEYTTSAFRAAYGREMHIFRSNTEDPAQYPQETAFLAQLIGDFTSGIIAHVRGFHPDCRFEVLYPTDVNSYPLNAAVNYPAAAWTPAVLDCLKTESFTFTFLRNLDLSRGSIEYGGAHGFPPAKRSHLVGIGDSVAAWLKEVRQAQGAGFESVVLFALDQFCLIGYPTPLKPELRRSLSIC